MRSGIPDSIGEAFVADCHATPLTTLGAEDIIARTAAAPVARFALPGTRTVHTNVNFARLERIVEKTSGQDIRSVLPARTSAVIAAREARREHGARVPMHWAATQTDLGMALIRLGQRESSPATLEEAVRVLRQALEVRTRDCGAMPWQRLANMSRTHETRKPRRVPSGVARPAFPFSLGEIAGENATASCRRQPIIFPGRPPCTGSGEQQTTPG